MEIHGKVALITGGAHRIGRAIALMLARHGAQTVINYLSATDAAQTTVADAQAFGVDAYALQADIADPDAVAVMIERIQRRSGGVDILVNSAGLFQATPFPTDDLVTWRRVVEISLFGTFYVSNALASTLVARRGTIVNILDLSIDHPWRNFSAHAVGKAGMLALTHQLSLELAPHVRVNGVAPGAVLPPPGYDEAKIKALARRTLLERWGDPEDVAGAVRYLLEAEYVTGTVLTVDGGESLSQRRT